MRLSGWKKIFPGDHIEQMNGTFAENKAYCTKAGNALVEFGIPPNPNGLKAGLQLIKRKAEEMPPGEGVWDIAENPLLFEDCIRYPRAIQGYIDHHRGKKVRTDFSKPDIYYLWGPPGSGKTRYVYDHEIAPFRVPDAHGSWRDGYALHEAVLYDNLESGRITDRTRFLEELDRYPMQVPIKGGFTWWKPKRIFITALEHPGAFAKIFADPEEFKRRVTLILTFPRSI